MQQYKIKIVIAPIYRNSDEEDESNSYDLETVEQALGNLQVDAHNANMSPVQGMLCIKYFMFLY